ncbi:hypothetical protein Q0590_25110 [Rhodocytophaga aerolata]|uniref:Uncharacterized protein n=1 Tax=Rhodocytophaga aerolata TaxID=455078 RepID=A0ABT8RBU7_9BACT|nr:hypothetical protein [Rhodocytophaga aerolata]MDO1449581.1 hypothetical protein [Rhodocytophaga aerolata]
MVINRNVIILFAILAIGAGYYLLFVRMNVRNALAVIGEAKTKGFDNKFIIAWATAMKKQTTTFAHEGKNYDTVTGKSK